jgi:hypothetical protein
MDNGDRLETTVEVGVEELEHGLVAIANGYFVMTVFDLS